MRRTRRSLKRATPSPTSSKDDEPVVKKTVSKIKIPHQRKNKIKSNNRDNESSSSESDIGDYLQPIDKLDLSSSFFAVPKKEDITSFDKIEKDIFAGVTRLSDSETDEEMVEVINSAENLSGPKFRAKSEEGHSGNQSQNPERIARLSFQQIEDYTKKIEEAKKEVEKYKARKQSTEKLGQDIKENKVDITKLLEAGEKVKTEPCVTLKEPSVLLTEVELHSSDFESCSDSDKEDWEEIKVKDALDTKEKVKVPKDGLQITVEMPTTIRKKKRIDMLAAMKRRLNNIRKQNQVYVHKVHLLCWIAHGNFVNVVINNEKILASALSLLPSKESYPYDRPNLSYLEKTVQWYKKTIKLSRKPVLNSDSLLNIEDQISEKEARNKKMLVYIFIAVLRALGMQCRLVVNFQVEPLRPPASELHSLSTKPVKKVSDKKSPKNSKQNQAKVNEPTISDKEKSKVDAESSTKQDKNVTRKGASLVAKNDTSEKDKQNTHDKKSRRTSETDKHKGRDNVTDKEGTKTVANGTQSACKQKPVVAKKDAARLSIENKNKRSLSRSPHTETEVKKKTVSKSKVKIRIKNQNTENNVASSSNDETNKRSNVTKKVKNINNGPPLKNEHRVDQPADEPLRSRRRSTRNKNIHQTDGCGDSDLEDYSILDGQYSLHKVNYYNELEPQFKNLYETCNNQSENVLDYIHNCTMIPQLDGTDDVPKKSLEIKTKSKPNPTKVEKTFEEKSRSVRQSRRSKSDIKYNEDDSDDVFTSGASSELKKSKPHADEVQKSRPLKTTSRPAKAKSTSTMQNGTENLVKDQISEKKVKSITKSKRKSIINDDSGDSDYVPEPVKKKHLDSDDEFIPEEKQRKRTSVKKTKVDRRVLSSDSEDEKEKGKQKKGLNVWAEVFLEGEGKWISVDVVHGQVHCVNELYTRATQPVTYVVAWNNDNSLKDITRRYCANFNTTTRKLRVDSAWWEETLKPFMGESTALDKEEDDELMRQQLEKPLPTTISEYKNHPLYVLKRHLLKFQALYPSDAPPLGFVREEAVYSRECVYTLHSRDIWLKDAKVVKPGEKPYKIVKARPRYDRLSNTIITDQKLEVFGPWQTQEYEPPTAENGVVPRNAYGNVELFKPCMLPKKTVHLQLPGLNKTARRMNIDCAPALVGFDFHSGWTHPTYDGFVVCEEYSDQLVAAWELEQEETERREEEKFEKRVYDNWKRLIKGLLIKERLKAKYNFGGSSSAKKEKKKSKAPKFCTKK